MKNCVQQRHLRRLNGRLIVRRIPQIQRPEENQKSKPQENETRRRKKSFRVKCRKKTHRKKTQFQTASFPLFSFRRWHESKESVPLRYVGLRLLKPQGVLFADGSDRHFHAVITNEKLEGGKLLEWHREKAGTVEHTHDEVKNELGGGHVPSQRFGVNAAWFKLALLAYNVVSAIKGLCLDGDERTARLKRFRLLLIHVAGRMNRNNCVMGLRLCHDRKVIERMKKVWEVFDLPTQATSAKALGKRGG